MEKEQTQPVGDEEVYGSSHLLKLHVIGSVYKTMELRGVNFIL